MKTAKRKRHAGRAKIDGLERINITLTGDERSFLEKLGNGKGLVAGIRTAIERVRSMKFVTNLQDLRRQKEEK